MVRILEFLNTTLWFRKYFNYFYGILSEASAALPPSVVLKE